MDEQPSLENAGSKPLRLVSGDEYITTLIGMTMGVLLAIAGSLLISRPEPVPAGTFLLGAGLMLTFSQYAGITRRRRWYLSTANVIILLLATFFALLPNSGPTLFRLLMAAVGYTTFYMNRSHQKRMRAEEKANIQRPRLERISLAEILGAFVILALIFGPASLLSR